MSNNSTVIHAAVHLISHSMDHFHMLVQGEDVQELVDAVVDQCTESMAYISDVYVATSDPSIDDELFDAIREMIDEADEDE